MKVWMHVLFQLLGVLISVGTMMSHAVPPKYQALVVVVVSTSQGVLAWYNHYYDPDGNPIPPSK